MLAIEILANLEERARKFFTSAINIVLIICVINTGLLAVIYRENLKNQHEMNEIKKVVENNTIILKKKVDHRYFNTTRTLEGIHGVKVNTLNGELK